jgi:hypothetical protein
VIMDCVIQCLYPLGISTFFAIQVCDSLSFSANLSSTYSVKIPFSSLSQACEVLSGCYTSVIGITVCNFASF